MNVRLNGQDKQIDAGTTVAQLLESLQLTRDGIAVAVDLEVVPKTAHAQTELREGARIEVIRAVGGG